MGGVGGRDLFGVPAGPDPVHEDGHDGRKV